MAPLSKRMSSSGPGTKPKQATLFTFFGKKKPATAKAATKGTKGTSVDIAKKPNLASKNSSAHSRKSVKKSTPPVFRKKEGSGKLEDTTDEEEWDDKDDVEMSNAESESEFEDGGEDDGEESELDYDEEDDDEPSPVSRKRRQSGTATSQPKKQKNAASNTPVPKLPPTSTRKTPSKTVSLTSFAREVTPSNAAVSESRSPMRASPAAKKPHATPSTTQKGSNSVSKPTMFVKGALNTAGSHLHNHLSFLTNLRDSKGRTRDHPDYDCRTLKVVKSEYEKVAGGNMTDAVQQWWDIKAQHFDCVLLFKTGKFYEMFHSDADVGVQVLSLTYMKGHVAHAGFPEISYGNFANLLCRAGYKVARVEQTETPDMLKVRKKNMPRGAKTPKVVNREVCSILTLGTRTCCFLDDNRVFDENRDVHIGPLLSIAEKPLTDRSAEPTLVREFGVTLVDAPRGWVTIGQFQDDALCSNLQTLLASFGPSEILYQENPNEKEESRTQQTLQSLLKAYRVNSIEPCRIEVVKRSESFPKSTAINPQIRKQLDRANPVRPWDVQDTLNELRRIDYFSTSCDSHGEETKEGRSVESSWPIILQQAIENVTANGLVLQSFGCSLYYLSRNLVAAELLSMGIVNKYDSPTSTFVLPEMVADSSLEYEASISAAGQSAKVDAMSLEGTTLHNLEILASIADNKVAGSLWSRLYHTKTPHGSRMLRAWLLRPLFIKQEIDKRADAVEELACGSAASACDEARRCLSECGDIERLLSRVHSMGGSETNNGVPIAHPSDRAVLYEEATYTRRKVGDFSKVLKGLDRATRIPELFESVDIDSELLKKVVRKVDNGGCFPDMRKELDFYFDNLDLDKCAEGKFEPNRGIDMLFDQACDDVERIRMDLREYKREVSQELCSRGRAEWKYINTDPDKKDKYLIELPASVRVPGDFVMKGKRGSGAKQVNKYYTAVVEDLVKELEQAYDLIQDRRAKGLQLVFAKFDSQRALFEAAASATAILDALCALAQLASFPGYTRPHILEYEGKAIMSFEQARHPCVEGSGTSSDFIPNDLSLGAEGAPERVLLLSGPNMGGKSTLLRQTCIIAILAQIGGFVPAEQCSMTPVDRIYTRLGASDRILLGQSTFFVELSETASALRGATNRSLAIMDELGRGTSTFDGTAIASATIKHLVERNQCLALFATHYHNLLDWGQHPLVRLGHMECMVENEAGGDGSPSRVTFLYTLANGPCPKSFGINVARLAGLPTEVLMEAGEISCEFEKEMNQGSLRAKVEEAIISKDYELVRRLWSQIQS